jgi:hypothetical protein
MGWCVCRASRGMVLPNLGMGDYILAAMYDAV